MLQLSSNRKSREICRSTENFENSKNNNNSKTSTRNIDNEMCPNCREDRDAEVPQDGLPKYSSALTMVQKIGGKDRKVRVVLKIYSSMYGSYGVVSQDRIIVKDCGYINLKTCTVFQNKTDLSVQIIQRNCEGLSLTFQLPNDEELEKLMKFLEPEDLGLNMDDLTITATHNKENYHQTGSGTVLADSKLNKLWKRDLSPRSPCDKRKGSLPALDESEETEESSESDSES